MPNKYVRKTNRGMSSIDMYERAFEKVILKGESIRSAAASYNINYMSLHRFIKKKKAYQANLTNKPPSVGYVHPTVFTKDEENTLCECLLTCATLNDGITRKEMRNLAFMLAKKRNKKFPASWEEKEMAGDIWLKLFLKRHPDLSLQLPQTTNKPGPISSIKTYVSAFFKNYTDVLSKNVLDAKDIWNVIETGITTAQNPDRVIARLEGKQSSTRTITLAEEGTLVTLALAGNAIGNYIPPMFIFPSEEFQEHFIRDGPVGSVGTTNKFGWMHEDEFHFYLQHFKNHVRPSKKQQSLLLLEDHSSYMSAKNIDFCRENGIILLTVPTHCSHKLQPMDPFMFGPLKKAIITACDNWKITNARKVISIYNIPSITKTAFDVAITAKNISAGFAVTGTWPVNTDIFGDIDFLPSRILTSPISNQILNIAENKKKKQAETPIKFIDIVVNDHIKIEANIITPAASLSNMSDDDECLTNTEDIASTSSL